MSDVFVFTPGWVDDGGHNVIAQSFGSPVFGDVAPHLMLASEPPSPILLYKAWYDVLGGKYPDYPAQQIGDCTSFGHGHANDLLQCIEIVFGEPSEYQETDTEALYGAAREVAGMLHSWGDGCYGAAVVKAMMSIGVVSRKMLGDSGSYSGNRAKSWGNSGIPASVRQMAAQYKLGAVAKVVDAPSCISALWNGYPVSICSNQGFTMARDQDGHCAGSGHWGHCMFIAGYDPGKRRFCIVQSWGPNTPSGPTYLDQPDFSFWADRDLVERNILSEGDSWALMKSPDFARRAIPSAWVA